MRAPDRQELDQTLGMVRELSALLQQKADELAARHRERLQVFEFAPQAGVITDAKGRVLAANLAAEDLLRLPRRRIVGRYLSSLLGMRVRAFATRFDFPGGCGWRLELR